MALSGLTRAKFPMALADRTMAQELMDAIDTPTLAAPLTITSASANALAVGPNGTTTPTFNIDASTASAVTGLKITGAAAAAGVALVVTSSGTDESLTLNAKGAGTITLNGTATGTVSIGSSLTLSAVNIITDTTTGMKIGTATTQKIGFFNKAPVVQLAADATFAGFTSVGGSAVLSQSTFTGGGTAAYSIDGLVKQLKLIGLLAA